MYQLICVEFHQEVIFVARVYSMALWVDCAGDINQIMDGHMLVSWAHLRTFD